MKNYIAFYTDYEGDAGYNIVQGHKPEAVLRSLETQHKRVYRIIELGQTYEVTTELKLSTSE